MAHFSETIEYDVPAYENLCRTFRRYTKLKNDGRKITLGDQTAVKESSLLPAFLRTQESWRVTSPAFGQGVEVSFSASKPINEQREVLIDRFVKYRAREALSDEAKERALKSALLQKAAQL